MMSYTQNLQNMYLQLSEIDEILNMSPSRVGLKIILGSQISPVLELEPAKVHVLKSEDTFLMHDDADDDYLMHDDDEDDFIIT
jgi:hypothetical protein